MNDTIEYMQNLVNFKKKGIPIPKGWKYSCIEDFVLRNGNSYTEIVPYWDEMMKMKECFKNVYEVSTDNKGLTYVEGYAKRRKLIITLHAWCITKEDKVIDPTWKDGVEYFGVPFLEQYLFETLYKRQIYGILDNWENKFPLLRGVPKNKFLA